MDLKDKRSEQTSYMKTKPMHNASILRKFASMLYMMMGRRGLGKFFYISKDCGTCQKCAEVCPNHAIKTFFGRPFWTFKCKGCLVCMASCPENSIQASSLKIILTIGLLFLPYEAWVQNLFQFTFIGSFGAFNGFLLSTAFWALCCIIGFLFLDRILTILFSFGFVKRFLNLKVFRIIREEIDPLAIYPVIGKEDHPKAP